VVTTGSFLKLDLKMSLTAASNPVINSWVFHCLDAEETNSLQNIGLYIFQQFLEKYYVPLAAYFTSDLRCTGASIRDLSNPADGFDIATDFGMGSTPGTMCPPFVTYSIQMQRARYDIRNGRKGLPAVPVGNLNAFGQIVPSIKTAMQTALSTAWEGDFNVEAGAAVYTFEDVIARIPPAGGNPTVWSHVSSYAVRGLGSQNSRK